MGLQLFPSYCPNVGLGRGLEPIFIEGKNGFPRFHFRQINFGLKLGKLGSIHFLGRIPIYFFKGRFTFKWPGFWDISFLGEGPIILGHLANFLNGGITGYLGLG